MNKDKKIMRNYPYLICFCILILTGCSKRILTVDNTAYRPAGGQTVGDNLDKEVTFATGDEKVGKPRANDQPTDDSARGRRERELRSLSFAENETLHVRITHYDPFGSSDRISLDLASLSDEFVYPYDGKLISNYGYRGRSPHTGVDIKAVPNDTIRSILDGVVRMSKNYSSYGNIVVIRPAGGLERV